MAAQCADGIGLLKASRVPEGQFPRNSVSFADHDWGHSVKSPIVLMRTQQSAIAPAASATAFLARCATLLAECLADSAASALSKLSLEDFPSGTELVEMVARRLVSQRGTEWEGRDQLNAGLPQLSGASRVSTVEWCRLQDSNL